MNLKGKKFENARLGMEIYVYEFDKKEWFIGKDMCNILEYGNSREAIKKHIWEEEKTTLYVKTLENIEKSQNATSQIINNNMTLITEIGLYQLVFRSKMPKAHEFQKWVFEDVLPSIRKNNYYVDSENISAKQLEDLEKEISRLKIEKGILHEIIYDISDATTMSFTEVSKKIFNKDAKYLKKILVEHKFLEEDGYTPLLKEADFKLPNGGVQKMRIFTTTNVEKCRKSEDIKYNKITNFGYMFIKKYFNKLGLTSFNFTKEIKLQKQGDDK